MNSEAMNTEVSMVVTLNPGTPDKSTTHKFRLAGRASLCFFIYASFLVICSIISSIIQIHGENDNEIRSRTIFGIYLYAVASIFYIYIEIVRCVRKKKTKKENKIKSEEMKKKKVSVSYNENVLMTEYQTKNNLVNIQENTKHGNKQDSKTLNVTEIDSSQPETERMRGFLKINNINSTIKRHPNAREFQTNTQNNDEVFLSEIPLVDDEEEVSDEIYLDLSKLGSIFSHHGSSFFLRIGSLLFGVGHVIYIIFELVSHEDFGSGCKSNTHWSELLVRLVFVVLQMFVLFKNDQFTVKQKSAGLHKFGYIHIVTTNLCMWISTLSTEIVIETDHLDNETVQIHETTPLTNTSTKLAPCVIMKTVSPYLFPFILEYCLLCFSIVAVLYLSLKEENITRVERGITNLFKIDFFENDNLSEDGSTNHQDENNMFSKSHRGIFAGCMLLAAVVVLIVFFALSLQYNKIDPELINLSTLIGLNLILLSVCIIAVYKLRVLSFIAKPYSIDDFMMFVAMFGGMMYNVSIIYAALHFIRIDKNISTTLEILRVLSSGISFVQQVIQTVLVAGGLRRYPMKASHIYEKPGRSCLSFLVIGNITAWIYYSIVAKTHQLQITPSKLFGELPWIILSNISLPLLLFFYFHSAVCMADIWHIAYHSVHQDNQEQMKEPENLQNNNFNNSFSVSDMNIKKNVPNGGNLHNLNSLMRSISVSQLVNNPKNNLKNENSAHFLKNPSLKKVPTSSKNSSLNRVLTSHQSLNDIKEYDNVAYM